MTPDTPATLKALRELCEKALPGPWTSTPREAECVKISAPPPFKCGEGCNNEFMMLMWPFHTTEETRAAEIMWYDTGEFIAASRTVVPILLRLLEETLKRHCASGYATIKSPLCVCGADYPCALARSAERALQELSQVLERQKE